MLRASSPSARLLSAVIVAVCLLGPAAAEAQVGTVVDGLILEGSFGIASIRLRNWTQTDKATAAGGLTMFVAYAPNGPLLVRFPFFGPFQADPDEIAPPPWLFRGVPSAIYYVAMVYGVVDSATIPNASWQPLVVPPPNPCTTAPGAGGLERQATGAVTDAVRVVLSSKGGCATSYVVEAGTTPGGSEVGAFEQEGILLSADNVPPGSYYLRVRGKNQYGVGPYSAVLPLAVPDCVATAAEITDLRATVVGQQVTLSWTPSAAPPGRPITYYEILIVNGGLVGGELPRVLVPTAVSSLTATVPSGTYEILMIVGNACSTTLGAGPQGLVRFTVP